MMALASNDETCSEWAVKNFGSITLGNIRRTSRVVKLAEALLQSPGASIPKLFKSEYEAVAVYDMLSRPESTPDALQQQHRELVAHDIENLTGTILLISDTSAMSYSHREEIESLGPVGDKTKKSQGFLVHSTIAARYCEEIELKPEDRRAPLDIVGLAGQTYVVRDQKPGKTKRRRHPHQWNESFMWQEDVARVKIRNRDDLRLIHVNDRESDIFDFYADCREAGHSFVIRASQNRALEGFPGEYLIDTLRLQKSVGEISLELRARPGKPARAVVLQLSFCSARLRSPYHKGIPAGSVAPAQVWAVRVWEESDEKDSIEWLLLTDQTVTTFEQARRMARIYSSRWVIEEFHKCLKTGLGAERLQLETAHRLQAAVAIFSIVALRLLVMREKLRLAPDASASEAGLTSMELAVLRVHSKKPLATVRDAVYAVARMGGHFTHNGRPGWQTLWHGMNKLRIMVEGVQISQKLNGKT